MGKWTPYQLTCWLVPCALSPVQICEVGRKAFSPSDAQWICLIRWSYLPGSICFLRSLSSSVALKISRRPGGETADFVITVLKAENLNQVPVGWYAAVNSLPADKWPPPHCVLWWRERKGFLLPFLIRPQSYECKMGTFMDMEEEMGRGDEKG